MEDINDDGASQNDKVLQIKNALASSDNDDNEELGGEHVVNDLVQDIHVGANILMSNSGQEQWSKLPYQSMLDKELTNILHETMDSTNACIQSPMDAFRVFLTFSIVQHIADCTKIEASSVIMLCLCTIH